MTTWTGPAGPRLLLDRCAGTCPTWALGPSARVLSNATKQGITCFCQHKLPGRKVVSVSPRVSSSRGFVDGGPSAAVFNRLSTENAMQLGVGCWVQCSSGKGWCNYGACPLGPGSEWRAPGWVAGKTRQG